MQNTKRVLSVLLVLVMALGLFAGCKKKEEEKVITADTSWYSDAQNEFTLNTAEQFYGLAELAKTKNFAGKTIKLGADISLNKVDASILKNWKEGKAAPKNVWTPIGSASLGFAGKFDGQGHKISGLYMNVTADGAGLFGKADYTAEIGNFKLVDSYIKTTKGKVGVIGQGLISKVENIYTNLIINASGLDIGGIIGWYQGSYTDKALGNSEGWTKNPMVVKNCWFDGEITTGSESQNIGGIVGNQDQRNRIDILNCLFTGTINVGREDGNTRVGGLYGWVNWSAQYNFKNCLSIGTINAENYASVGTYVGVLAADGLSFENCYGIGEKVIGSDSKNFAVPDGMLKSLDEIKALDIAVAFPKLDGETASPWEKVAGSTPILKDLK